MLSAHGTAVPGGCAMLGWVLGGGPGAAAANPNQNPASKPVKEGGIYSGAQNLICLYELCIELWWCCY